MYLASLNFFLISSPDDRSKNYFDAFEEEL
jgi:hypothetical protein